MQPFLLPISAIQCEECERYDPCISPCDFDCALLDLGNGEGGCNYTCVEGCTCPPGQYYRDGECVQDCEVFTTTPQPTTTEISTTTEESTTSPPVTTEETTTSPPTTEETTTSPQSTTGPPSTPPPPSTICKYNSFYSETIIWGQIFAKLTISQKEILHFFTATLNSYFF